MAKTASDKPEKKTKRPTAAKRVLQSAKRQARNRAYKSKIKTSTRSVKEAVVSKDASLTEEKLNSLYSVVDKGVKKGIITPNKAKRTKSRLAAQAAKV